MRSPCQVLLPVVYGSFSLFILISFMIMKNFIDRQKRLSY